jgi:Fur family transcriptional regulator, iron response regulator
MFGTRFLDRSSQIRNVLRESGLRPTRQREALGRLLFDGRDRHISAEDLHSEARANGIAVSVATVYNTLHQFTQAGLLRQVVLDGSKTYFDTNTSNHHHFLNEDDGSIIDIPEADIAVSGLPSPPVGMRVARVDVFVRLARK